MPRPLRIEFANAWYHVHSHSVAKQKAFKNAKHRELFLEILAEAHAIFGVEIHAYCLLDTHYHLLIKTPRANLSRAMRHINGLYTQRHNRLTHHLGPVFHGRYKTTILEEGPHLLEASRYIHIESLTAKPSPSQAFLWSSYPYYLKSKTKPAWLETSYILSMLASQKKIKQYKHYMVIKDEATTLYRKSHHPKVIGSAPFKNKLLKLLNKEKVSAYKGDHNRSKVVPTMNVINKACAHYFNIPEKALYSSQRGFSNEPRKIAIYACRTWGAETLSRLAERFHCNSHGSVSNAITDIKKRRKTNKKIDIILQRLQKIITK